MKEKECIFYLQNQKSSQADSIFLKTVEFNRALIPLECLLDLLRIIHK